VTAADLLKVPQGVITNEGFLRNIEISLIYLESWLRGLGCVPIFSLMEDAATAEISRAQLWQWNRYGVRTDDGTLIDAERIRTLLQGLLERKQTEFGPPAYERSEFVRAASLLMTFVKGPFRSFLTTELYDELD
jgi:malate synthase